MMQKNKQTQNRTTEPEDHTMPKKKTLIWYFFSLYPANSPWLERYMWHRKRCI